MVHFCKLGGIKLQPGNIDIRTNLYNSHGGAALHIWSNVYRETTEGITRWDRIEVLTEIEGFYKEPNTFRF